VNHDAESARECFAAAALKAAAQAVAVAAAVAGAVVGSSKNRQKVSVAADALQGVGKEKELEGHAEISCLEKLMLHARKLLSRDAFDEINSETKFVRMPRVDFMKQFRPKFTDKNLKGSHVNL
jgi:hypothetical protein